MTYKAIKRNGLNFLPLHLILCLLTCITAQGQKALIKGTVQNKSNGETIAGASVFPLSDKTMGVATDRDGNYELSLTSGTYQIVVSSTGMKSDTFSIVLKNEEVVVKNFSLQLVVNNLNVVVVSAGKYEQRLEDITVSMEVIKPKLIENRNTVNITSVLEQTPGINILDQEPQIRGGSGFSFGVGSRVATMIDGLPIMTGDAGRTDWQFIPVENIEQVEVIKGASSVLFGSSALSGTINFRTAYPKERSHTYVRTYGGVYDTPMNKEAKWWNGPANFSGVTILHAEKIKQFDFVIGANGVYDHGYIGPPINIASLPFQDTSINNNDVASRWGRLNFNLRYRFKKAEGLSVGLNGNFMQSHSNFSLVWANDTSGIYSSFPKTMTLTDSKMFYIDPYISFHSKGGWDHTLKSRIFYSNNDNGNEQSNKTDVYMTEYRFNKQFSTWSRLNLTGGLFYHQSFSTASLYAGSGSTKNTLENYALFLQLEKKVVKNLIISAGFRAEWFELNHKENEIKPIVRAGLNYQLTPGTFLRASYGQGYRYPTIAEKFIQTGAGGITVFSNPQIQPESSWNAEVGIKQGIKIGNFFAFADAAFFQQQYQNTIEYIYAIWRPDSAGFKFVNTGNSRVKGFEFSLMGEGKLSKDFSFSILGGYTYILPQSLEPATVFAVDSPSVDFTPTPLSYSNTSTDTTNNILKYRFNNLAKVDVELTWKTISVGYSIRYYSFMKNIDKTFYDLDEPYLLPTGIKAYRTKHHSGAIVHDLRLGVKITKMFKASALVNNIANLEYSLRPLKIESPRTYTIQLVAEF
jgi:iron complex outermembrane receptor protein